MRFIGLDAGSVAVKLVVLDRVGNKLEGHYLRHLGHPARVSLKMLKELQDKYPESSLSITGSAGKAMASALGINAVNEIVAFAHSVKRLHPHIRTVIELGGEDSKLIILEHGRIKDFSMNSVCAAGTGSFLEQQAERLRLNIEEFGDMAEKAQRPAKIAGRCSVFAKSDMIHLQQIATPVEDIVAGLCFAVARNFRGSIARGRDIIAPAAFLGGVAANKGMVRAFREVLSLDELFVPSDFALMGAIGAAMKDMDEDRANSFDTLRLNEFLSFRLSDQGHPPLLSEGDGFLDRHGEQAANCGIHIRAGEKTGAKVKAFLGIDIGSISTNLALLDEDGELLAKRYLMTAGRPIEAVNQGLTEIEAEIGNQVEISGVATTGSGRYMIADYVGADIVKNEITAQATAAISIDPTVDTILEIGGQDSKYISIRDGVITDFEMNKACAAGTGSFLEEQAEKINVSVKEEFACSAFGSKCPSRLGERCTVFMENSLMANLQRGADRNDLLAGLAYSIVQNYINRVVAGKPIGNNIFFQGGVAFNKAVVAAFEKYLGRNITVPPDHDVTGAIGMALIAMKHMKTQGESARSKFKGFGLAGRGYEISSFECKGCPNVCEINRIKVEGEKGHLHFGGRCEKYDVRKARQDSLPDFFSFREEQLWKAHLDRRAAFEYEAGKRQSSARSRRSQVRIGIPYIFFFQDYLPLWSTLLWELGFEVLVSPRTNKQIVNLGLESVISEACFPVKAAHGHIKYLAAAGADSVFVPSFVTTSMSGNGNSSGNLTCPHTQTIPYVSRAAMRDISTLAPVINFTRGLRYVADEIARAFSAYNVTIGEVQQALKIASAAQEDFFTTLRAKGREVLGSLAEASDGCGSKVSPVVVVVGRAYNAFDPGVNLDIPNKLSNIGVLSIPMDFLPLEYAHDSWPNMYWRSGRRILNAANIIRNTPGLYAIYISNFSCGPDSFIIKYFNEKMAGKPFLHIEIDEHSADAGAITRCEAFLDSIGGQTSVMADAAKTPADFFVKRTAHRFNRRRTVYIPGMSEHAFALQAAFEHCGARAEVLPESDRESVDIGRKYVSGKECFPYIVTAGDMLKKVFSSDFRPSESAFFMPSGSGPCRFGQYNVAHNLILKKIGLTDVPIFSPNQDARFYNDLGMVGKDFYKRSWTGIIAFELLTKCLHETRPHEKVRGDAEGLHGQYRARLLESLRSGNGSVDRVMADMARDFRTVPRRDDKRPMIGVVGEIFVRSHKFSNEDLVRKIEALGGEVWLAPVEEWLYYINAMSMRKALIKKDRSAIMNIFLKTLFQKRVEHRLAGHFRGFLKTLDEPPTKEILKKAAPYVHDSFEGETVLSMGKSIDLIERGAAGIIAAMPFGCMPGTIVTALMKAVSRDYGVPVISIPYDGSESPSTTLNLEAFMEAVKIREDKEVISWAVS